MVVEDFNTSFYINITGTAREGYLIKQIVHVFFCISNNNPSVTKQVNHYSKIKFLNMVIVGIFQGAGAYPFISPSPPRENGECDNFVMKYRRHASSESGIHHYELLILFYLISFSLGQFLFISSLFI